MVLSDEALDKGGVPGEFDVADRLLRLFFGGRRSSVGGNRGWCRASRQ